MDAKLKLAKMKHIDAAKRRQRGAQLGKILATENEDHLQRNNNTMDSNQPGPSAAPNTSSSQPSSLPDQTIGGIIATEQLIDNFTMESPPSSDNEDDEIRPDNGRVDGTASQGIVEDSLTDPQQNDSENQDDPQTEDTNVERELEALGIATSYDPTTEETGETETQQTPQGSDEIDIQDVIYKSAPQGRRILCKIIRKKNGLESFFPQYELFMEMPGHRKVFLMSAKKRKKTKAANYVISDTRNPGKKQKGNVIGKVRSNFLGTLFNIYDGGYNPFKKDSSSKKGSIRQELGDPNVLGFKGPRKMTCIVPGMDKSNQRVEFKPKQESDTMMSRFKHGRCQDLLTLHNKSPQWNDETQSYVLNFNGRVTQASVKNFQIIHDSDLDYIIMQFGRVGDDTFSMDFQYPMCALQAFAIALSSFDAKLACE